MTHTYERGLSYVVATGSNELSNETVGDALVRLATDAAHSPALAWLTDMGTESMSWSELYRRSSGAARVLLRRNPARARVALVSYNSVDWIVAMFGCALAGMPLVPLSPSVTDAEADYLLSHARVGVVLAVESVGDDRVFDRMRALGDKLSQQPSVCDITEVNTPIEHLIRPDSTIGSTDEFLVQYTSGTTGQPKAASLSHRSAINAARIYAQACGARFGDTHLNPLPLYHVGGSLSGLVVTLSFGGTYIVIERFSPELALRAVREIRPALVGLVPTMLIDLLKQPGATESDFASVRTVIGGATAVDPALIEDIEKRLGITFAVAYGQSEAPMMAASSSADPARVRTRTLGRCLPGRDYRVLDATGQVVPTGTPGELCVRGPLVMSGYLRPDGSLDSAHDTQGWLHTGDLCTMNDDAILSFRGRIREVIIRGGENIYPAELEQTLSVHESVSEIAVFGVPDERLGERVVAAVLPAPGSRVESLVLSAFAEFRLSRHKRPTEWIEAATLPRTSTGKVRKHILKEWYLDGTIQARCGPNLVGD